MNLHSVSQESCGYLIASKLIEKQWMNTNKDRVIIPLFCGKDKCLIISVFFLWFKNINFKDYHHLKKRSQRAFALTNSNTVKSEENKS